MEWFRGEGTRLLGYRLVLWGNRAIICADLFCCFAIISMRDEDVWKQVGKEQELGRHLEAVRWQYSEKSSNSKQRLCYGNILLL